MSKEMYLAKETCEETYCHDFTYLSLALIVQTALPDVELVQFLKSELATKFNMLND